MDFLSSVSEAIRKASEAYVEALSTATKALQGLAAQTVGEERDRVLENWLRMARMSKDGVVSALEQGFELWEREVRRALSTGPGMAGRGGTANPMEVWAENWRRATQSLTQGGAWADEMRKQAEAFQKTLDEGLKAWGRLWELPREK